MYNLGSAATVLEPLRPTPDSVRNFVRALCNALCGKVLLAVLNNVIDMPHSLKLDGNRGPLLGICKLMS